MVLRSYQSILQISPQVKILGETNSYEGDRRFVVVFVVVFLL